MMAGLRFQAMDGERNMIAANSLKLCQSSASSALLSHFPQILLIN